MGTHFAKADDTNVIRVVEDWELEVKQPDLDTPGTADHVRHLSPSGNTDGVFAAFNLNHPRFVAWIRPFSTNLSKILCRGQSNLWKGRDLRWT